MPSLRTQRPRPLHLALEPEEVAARLAHLPGFCWLDTAGNCPAGLSLLTASDQRIRGHLSDVRELRAALAIQQAAAANQPDWGFPVSGLFGNIDYEGHFCFAVCEDLLIYEHATARWWACGELLEKMLPSAPTHRDVQLEFAADWTQQQYEAAAARAQAWIAAGDIYQVNIAHRIQAAWPPEASAFALYQQLRVASPAPYGAFFKHADYTLLSTSPEQFLKMSGPALRTRPIKGTRPRFREEAPDQKSALDLISSEKERAELLMITDLLRNDLGRVCAYGSVHVPELLRLEAYEQVFHLVSTVEGMLADGRDHLDALQACLPGGSITGAPKRRAREIIAELEARPRGPYTGVVGYLGSNGESQFNIAIRTLVIEKEHAHFHVGAGIVADSSPTHEWQETWHKAAGILRGAQPSEASFSGIKTGGESGIRTHGRY